MKTPDVIIETARKLRKNMTLAEIELWKELKTKKILGNTFYRQKPVFVYKENSGLNRYIIPDFVCITKKIVIEIDGNVHDLKEVYELDKYKEKLLINLGYKILRFTNEEIFLDLENVIKRIKNNIL